MTVKNQETMTKAELEAYVEKLQAENDKMKAEKASGRQPLLRLVTAEDEQGNVYYSGTLAIYGTRQWPLSFYGPEMQWIVDNIDMIRTFLQENKDNISWDKNDEEWKERRRKYKEVVEANRAKKKA